MYIEENDKGRLELIRLNGSSEHGAQVCVYLCVAVDVVLGAAPVGVVGGAHGSLHGHLPAGLLL